MIVPHIKTADRDYSSNDKSKHTLKCIRNGTPKTNNFPFVPNGKLMYLGVSIFKHNRVTNLYEFIPEISSHAPCIWSLLKGTNNNQNGCISLHIFSKKIILQITDIHIYNWLMLCIVTCSISSSSYHIHEDFLPFLSSSLFFIKSCINS